MKEHIERCRTVTKVRVYGTGTDEKIYVSFTNSDRFCSLFHDRYVGWTLRGEPNEKLRQDIHALSQHLGVDLFARHYKL